MERLGKISRRDLLRYILGGGAGALIAGDFNRKTAAAAGNNDQLKARIEQGTIIDGIALSGIPDRVDRTRVDVAKGPFKNETGVLPHIFAKPGGLLVGPDFGNPEGSPWGGNPGGWKTMYESKGSIHPFSSVTQEVLRWAPPAFQNCPEGGFALFAGAQMDLEVRGAAIGLPNKGREHIYIIAVRGIYTDGQKDTPERNTTIRLTDYIPGHTMALMYQSRLESNLAFIDEEQMLQFVATAHTSGTNGGAEGQTVVTVLGYDVNTQAIEWSRHWSRERDVVKAYEGTRVGWQRVYSNYR